MKKSYVVIVGDPMRGFVFVGPFDDKEGAKQFAEDNFRNDSFVAELHTAEAALQ